eukprot:SAG31_NODE_1784_length_7279_cov_2.932869_4_plen_189_part_00
MSRGSARKISRKISRLTSAAADRAAVGPKPTPLQLYGLTGRLLLFCQPGRDAADAQRLSQLNKKLAASFVPEAGRNYASLALQRAHSASWIRQARQLCAMCLTKLAQLRPGMVASSFGSELHMLICLTDWKNWKLTVPAAVHPVLGKLVENFIKHMVRSTERNQCARWRHDLKVQRRRSMTTDGCTRR